MTWPHCHGIPLKTTLHQLTHILQLLVQLQTTYDHTLNKWLYTDRHADIYPPWGYSYTRNTGVYISSLCLFHTTAYFYVIYKYVFSKWRSIRPVEINQYDFTMVTDYDITIGNDIARDVHCEITMGNDVARDVHCDITMSNDVTTYTYHGITMHNDDTMNIFYYVFFALCLIVLFYYR